MFVFIDESGDSGFKIEKGSSKTFVVVLIVFNDEIEAEETALKIKKLRRKLGKSDNFEFKFNKCSKKYRLDFLRIITNCKFRIRAIVFEKEKVYSLNLRKSKETFFNYAVKLVLEHNNKTISNAKIRLDGRGERLFRRKLTTYLRQQLNTQTRRIIKNLRFRNSKTDVLIQLADMVAGTLRRYFDANTQDYQEYRNIIRKREGDIWIFK